VRAHPYFQSRPIWDDSLSDARKHAAEQGKRIFLTIGRIDCGGSRALVEKTISKEEIFEYLVERFVCVARDADALDDDERALVATMRSGQKTPLCLYLDEQGRVVLDTAGGRPPAVFLNDLMEGATRRVA
jgi:thioredoxin-related protein